MATEQAKKVTKPNTRNSRSAAAKNEQSESTPQTPEPSPKPDGPAGMFTREQRAGLLAQAQTMVNEGASLTAAAEALGLRPDTLRRWRGGGQASQTPAQRVRALEQENKQLKQAVASLATKVADLETSGLGDEADVLRRTREALATIALKVVEAGASKHPTGPVVSVGPSMPRVLHFLASPLTLPRPAARREVRGTGVRCVTFHSPRGILRALVAVTLGSTTRMLSFA